MYKLKIKSQHSSSTTTKFFNTLQEVAEQIKTICNASNLAEVLKHQKEFNFRFYVTFKKD